MFEWPFDARYSAAAFAASNARDFRRRSHGDREAGYATVTGSEETANSPRFDVGPSGEEHPEEPDAHQSWERRNRTSQFAQSK
jgi:hypothetical protein